MFGIGSMEMAIVAIVALVVIGPERLPTVMGQVGRWYRKLRTMSNELLAEARLQWDEGMKEVEGVTNSINSAWQDATTAESQLPPPPVRQLPVPLAQARTAADAGPWILPAWLNPPSPDVEPLGEAVRSMTAPTMLPRRIPEPYDPATNDVMGAPTLMGPAATADEIAAMAYELPPENGENPQAIRERTMVDLYLDGGTTLDGAARFLGVSEDDFRDWVEMARLMRASRV